MKKYCGNCKYFQNSTKQCDYAVITKDVITGEQKSDSSIYDYQELNKNNDCIYYRRKLPIDWIVLCLLLLFLVLSLWDF